MLQIPEPPPGPASEAIIDMDLAEETIVSDVLEENGFFHFLKLIWKNIVPIAIVCLLLGAIFILAFWLRSRSKTSEPSHSQSQVVSKEKVKGIVPEPNYSEINRLEMEKLPKVQPNTLPVQQQKQKQKEFWPTFFENLKVELVGKPPVQKQEAPNTQKTKEEKTENLASKVSPSVVEPPKEPVASKPSVQNDVSKKVSQAPAKKSEKPKVVSKPKQTSSKIQWIPSGKNYIPVKEGNRGFTGSNEPDISKPSGWERAKWRLLGTNDNCYWGLLK